MKRRWSERDLEILRDMYPSHATNDVAAAVGRSAEVVRKMAQWRGIAKTKEFIVAQKAAQAVNCPGRAVETRIKPDHGFAKPDENGKRNPTYSTWRTMHQRCNYAGHKSYADYGGRGIKVCERWRSFSSFLEDVGHRPDGMTLGRIDNDGDYEPGNVRWETQKQQARNRRNSKYLTAFGETMLRIEWCERFRIRQDTLSWRLKKGACPEDALTTPVAPRRYA